ncbi:MAG: hypothetical protein QF618_01775 [SAR324 cluster bacterium]|nr:hypothetical protein [SAR324 cluster bacterium]
MSLSEDAIQGARQYARTPKNHALAWIAPGDIKALVEDQTVYDPVVEHVQQSRAGRFVIPAYVPENPPPSFPLVSDHTKALRESNALQEQIPEMPLPGENTSSTDESLEIPSAVDVEALSDVEELVQDFAGDTEISALKPIPAEESPEESAEELAVESTDEQTQAETEESTKSKSAKSGISAASLFDEIEVEEEQDEEFDFDTGGLQGAIEDDSDVVFGDGRIEQNSITKFVSNYPDSTIKFLLRKSLDGRPLPAGYDEIYLNWENRGLSRGRLKKYLFKLMDWQDFPDIPVLDVVRKIRERHFELRAKNK